MKKAAVLWQRWYCAESYKSNKRLYRLYVITDVCMCEYTSHGHCGHIVNGDVDNDSTLEMLAREALSMQKLEQIWLHQVI